MPTFFLPVSHYHFYSYIPCYLCVRESKCDDYFALHSAYIKKLKDRDNISLTGYFLPKNDNASRVDTLQISQSVIRFIFLPLLSLPSHFPLFISRPFSSPPFSSLTNRVLYRLKRREEFVISAFA